jgi:glycosyltransferase involved in cell wall biosynthesis
MEEEFERWGLVFGDMYDRGCRKELAEYDAADAITVPSRFCRQTFVNEGVDPEKVKVIPYGIPTETFFPDGEAPTDTFRVLFVGQVCLRKGIPYLLDAFARFRHPRKELLLAGLVAPDIKSILKRFNLEKVQFLGHQPREELRRLMSTSSLMVLPSIEEGLAIVQGQALACGCPLLITDATGGEELIENGVQGLIVQPRSSSALLQALNEFAENPAMRARMAEAALVRSRANGGWKGYAQLLVKLIGQLAPTTPVQPNAPN